MNPGSDASVAFSALSGAGTTLVTGDEEVTALAVSPAGDELLVGLADGSVNSHALPSGTATTQLPLLEGFLLRGPWTIILASPRFLVPFATADANCSCGLSFVMVSVMSTDFETNPVSIVVRTLVCWLLALLGDLLATITRFPAAAARAVGYLGNSLYLAASEEPGLRVMARANPVKVTFLLFSSCQPSP